MPLQQAQAQHVLGALDLLAYSSARYTQLIGGCGNASVPAESLKGLYRPQWRKLSHIPAPTENLCFSKTKSDRNFNHFDWDGVAAIVRMSETGCLERAGRRGSRPDK
jgi:hypothetical protein